ncbi:MAG: RidA family protein [Roseovarius sp.]|nr:RidA family protein [Roseovarius sp.]
MNTEDLLPSGGHYSAGRRVGNLIFTAGQVPRDEKRSVIGKCIIEQTEATFHNLQSVLSSYGAGLEDIVKATVHLQDLSDVTGFNEVYARFFPGVKPVRTVVGSNLNGILVEIDVIAVATDDN